MAEYLIYNTLHWMDKLTPEEVMKRESKDPRFRQKYDSRYQIGDIVEQQPDGYWTGPKAKKFRKDVFSLVCAPGMKVNLDLVKPEILIVGEEKQLIKTRKYRIKTEDITLDVNKTATVLAAELPTLLVNKTEAVSG